MQLNDIKPIFVFIMAVVLNISETEAENPFFGRYHTPHQTLPFDEIKIKHFMPAYEKAYFLEDVEIKEIVDNEEAPTFENTIEALERTGQLLHDVNAAFSTLCGSENNDELMALASKIAVMDAEHTNKISLNEVLFARIKAVYDVRDQLSLAPDQQTLLRDTYDQFMENGAALQGAARDEYKALSVRKSVLEETFHQHSLKSTNEYEKMVTDKSLLNGLPEDVLTAAHTKAVSAGKEGWLFDLSAPSYVSLMKYAENRSLREELYRAYMTRAAQNENDNRPVIKELVDIRHRIALLMGDTTFAAFTLRRRMAENPANVYRFLDKLAAAYQPVAKAELEAVTTFASQLEGFPVKIEPWDMSYYSEKLRADKFDINDEILRPYFKLENVLNAVFGLSTKLYGITYKKKLDIPTWNKEVEAWEVFDKDGSYLAVLYTDFHPRKTKRAGAWMSDINEQYRLDGVDHRPHVAIAMNFTRPTASKPSLLTFDEVTTLLHEFGHALHAIFSDVRYRSQAGTNVYRDFVELPSQVMENWATEKEFLDGFAVHYQTGEKIPAALIQRIKDAENFNVGSFCVRQLGYGYLDMAWNDRTADFSGDMYQYERQAFEKSVVLLQPEDCLMSTTFDHIFSGGYAAGYYSYKWAEVLDADAYAFLTRNKVFDAEAAESFRENVLSRGGTEPPMQLYKRFRGQEPGIEALLRRNGIQK